MFLCQDKIILCACRSKQRLPVITYRHSWKSEAGTTKNIPSKHSTVDVEVEVEVEVDVPEENIETGKVLLADENIERTGVTGEEISNGGGGRGRRGGVKGGVKQIGRCHGCPVLSRYHCSSLMPFFYPREKCFLLRFTFIPSLTIPTLQQILRYIILHHITST